MRQEATQKQWRELFEVEDRIVALDPWHNLPNIDLVAVRCPPLSDTGFIVFYSSRSSATGEQQYGINVYRGENGLKTYFLGQMHEEAGMSPEYAMHRQDALCGYICGPEAMDGLQREYLKESGRANAGDRSLTFASFRPGFYPAELDADEVTTLTAYLRALEQAMLYRTEQDLVCEPDDDNLNVYWFAENEQGEWAGSIAPMARDTVHLAKIELVNGEFMNRLKARPRVYTTLQVDVLVLDAPVQDEKYDRPIRPYVVLVVDTEMGQVVSSDVPGPELHPAEMSLQAVISYIIDQGNPERIDTSNLEIHSALADLCRKCDIELRTVEDMPEMAMAEASLRMIAAPENNREMFYMGVGGTRMS